MRGGYTKGRHTLTQVLKTIPCRKRGSHTIKDRPILTWVSKTIPSRKKRKPYRKVTPLINMGIENDTRHARGKLFVHIGIENDTQQAVWKALPTQVLKTIPSKRFEKSYLHRYRKRYPTDGESVFAFYAPNLLRNKNKFLTLRLVKRKTDFCL